MSREQQPKNESLLATWRVFCRTCFDELGAKLLKDEADKLRNRHIREMRPNKHVVLVTSNIDPRNPSFVG